MSTFASLHLSGLCMKNTRQVLIPKKKALRLLCVFARKNKRQARPDETADSQKTKSSALSLRLCVNKTCGKPARMKLLIPKKHKSFAPSLRLCVKFNPKSKIIKYLRALFFVQ